MRWEMGSAGPVCAPCPMLSSLAILYAHYGFREDTRQAPTLPCVSAAPPGGDSAAAAPVAGLDAAVVHLEQEVAELEMQVRGWLGRVGTCPMFFYNEKGRLFPCDLPIPDRQATALPANMHAP